VRDSEQQNTLQIQNLHDAVMSLYRLTTMVTENLYRSPSVHLKYVKRKWWP